MDQTACDYEAILARFGLTSFRPGQKQVVDAVFEGQDCLCIMPTGGGKSLCFQLPALARSGTVLVVSPLIALMKDQVDALQQRSMSATFINSSLDSREQSDRISRMASGEFDLVYIAPERMRSQRFLDALEATEVQLLAIDEAHCISQWGHDFRPDYARLGRLREQIGSPQTIALTATATTTVRKDICEVLQLTRPRIFVSGFARENLALTVEQPSSNSDKDERLVQFVVDNPGCGIVYCSTRKSCDHVNELLGRKLKRKVQVYHAGLETPERKQVQERFTGGEIDIIVATNAFGMGIDKPDIRFVAHYNMPGSIEAYYQEAGRAGRDGNPSRCALLYSYQDRFIQEFFIENSYPSAELVKEVYDFLCGVKADPIELTLQEVQNELGVSIGTEGIRVSETLLEKCGALERLDSRQNLASIKITSQLPTIIDLLPREARKRRHVLREVESLIGDLREERVYFAPQELCEKTELDWSAVQRSLRELNKLDCFDYVPPFRGRAVHLLKREPFENLNIDFRELETRKQDEFRRLESVISFALSNTCRQQEILDYFGDSLQEPCRKCDNCEERLLNEDSGGALSVVDNYGCLYALQVALSGLARTHGRYGKNLVAQMLCGSSNRKMSQLGLKRLSTYGLLQGLSQQQAVDIIDCLINAKLATRQEQQKFRPLVVITPRGSDVMRGFHLGSALTFVPATLRQALNRRFRNQQPRIADYVPELHDTPQSIRPAADADLQDSQPAKLEPESTATMRTDTPHAELPEPVRPDREPTETLDQADQYPDYYWTWKLIQIGFSTQQAEQIRGLSAAEIAVQLELARENLPRITACDAALDWTTNRSVQPGDQTHV